MITEVISFYNELDLLEAHLEEHKGLAERTVVVECRLGMSGLEKPCYFWDNRERFERFNVEYSRLPDEFNERMGGAMSTHMPTFRANENRRRQWNHNLDIKTPWVLNSDVDEIFDHKRFDDWLPELEKDFQCIAVNLLEYQSQVNCRTGTKNSYRFYRADVPSTNLTAEWKKKQRRTTLLVKDGQKDCIGWHFANCPSTALEMREKAQTRPWKYLVEEPEDVPSVEYFESLMGQQVSFMNMPPHPMRKWKVDPLEILPTWMAENIHLFPTVPE
jgi:hypothetical protein